MNVVWIDIKRSMPVYDQQVLLCVEGDQTRTPPARRLALGARIATNARGEQFNISGYVTHWAVEPELPDR